MVITLKEIFTKEWNNFVRNSKSKEIKRSAVKKNVLKLIRCKTLIMGIKTYTCEKCSHIMVMG
jgi:hypothetical protein